MPSCFSNCSPPLMRTPTLQFLLTWLSDGVFGFLVSRLVLLKQTLCMGKFLPNLLARTEPSLILAWSLVWCLTALSVSAADLHSSKHVLVKSFVHFNGINKCFLT